jgi:hypothetical protein
VAKKSVQMNVEHLRQSPIKLAGETQDKIAIPVA